MIERLLAILAAAACLVSCAPRGPYELAFHPSAGRVLRYRLSSQQTIRQTLPGRTAAISQESAAGYRFTVRRTFAEGGALIEVVYERIRLDSRSPTGALSFDSSDPDSGTPALRGLKALVGQGLLLLVDRRGRIRDIQGLEELLESARTAAAASHASAQAVAQAFSREALESSLAGFFEFYPDRKVLPGDSWQTERSGGPGLALRLRHTWTLREVRRGRALLDLSTAILSAAPSEQGGLNGTQQGRLELELATGALISASIRQQIRGTILVKGLPVPMEITGSAAIRAAGQLPE